MHYNVLFTYLILIFTYNSGRSRSQPGGGGVEGRVGEGTGGVSHLIGGGSGGPTRENVETRAPRGTDRSPEYNERFYYKLDSRVKN